MLFEVSNSEGVAADLKHKTGLPVVQLAALLKSQELAHERSSFGMATVSPEIIITFNFYLLVFVFLPKR